VSDEGFHEIQLNGKQIVFLFMAATMVSVVIFLLGVYVGRGVQIQRAAQEAAQPAGIPPAETAAADAAAPADAAGRDALTYPQRLQGDKPVAETLKPESAPPVAAEEPPPAPAPPDASIGGWVVQVAALRDRDAALAIVRRLSDRKYPAFLLEPTPGAPAPVYRVRVGRYPERTEAEQVARRLEREEQFKPLITR
jgi:cell division septation protein DedD